MKKNDAYKMMTMPELMDALRATVDEINETEDIVAKEKLVKKCTEICANYNHASMIATYARCAKAEKPVMEFAKSYVFETIKTEDNLVEDATEDGQITSYVVRSIVKGEKNLDLIDFLTWAEKHNKVVTHDKAWNSAVTNARLVAENEWRKFFNSEGKTYTFKIGEFKEILQKMFDALVYIEGEKGGNAVVATSKNARYILGFANTRKNAKKDGKIVITGKVITTKQWGTLIMDVLHTNFEKKDIVILYGDEKPEENEEVVEPNQDK